MKKYCHKIDISVTQLEQELNAFSQQGYTIWKLWKAGYYNYEIIAYTDDIKEGANTDLQFPPLKRIREEQGDEEAKIYSHI